MESLLKLKQQADDELKSAQDKNRVFGIPNIIDSSEGRQACANLAQITLQIVMQSEKIQKYCAK